MNSVETAITIARIRELIAKHGVCRTARIVGRHKGSISRIKTGRRHGSTVAATLNDLELHKVYPAKVCRRCGEPRVLFSTAHVCVECVLFELDKKGLVVINRHLEAG